MTKASNTRKGIIVPACAQSTILTKNSCLYFDTDSVIYTSKPGDWEVERGNIFGDWGNQLEPGESHIVSFASLGPKTYSYVTDTGRVEIKAKGISQNGFTENILSPDLQQTGVALTGETFARLLDSKEEKLQIFYPSHLKKNSKHYSIRSVFLPNVRRKSSSRRISKRWYF